MIQNSRPRKPLLQQGTKLAGCLVIAVVVIVTGCAGPAPVQKAGFQGLAYLAEPGHGTISRHAPVIIPDETEFSYNRVGTPVARKDESESVEILIDPEQPTVYIRSQPFTTDHGSYLNLIYRYHFEKVPYSLIPFHLTAGRNVGVIVVITLDARERPVLITTVHTCGCFLAITPTSHLPKSAYPDNWDVSEQSVFGEHLTGRIDYPANETGDLQALIHLRTGTHRVRRISLGNTKDLSEKLQLIRVLPIQTLENLPLNGTTTSFFETDGWRKGYVKGSYKPLEMLLMSWWALDLNVGVDKKLGPSEKTGTVFYTSLAPWNREASDMWEFTRFLEFWGWKL